MNNIGIENGTTINTSIGNINILSELGSGGEAKVYKVEYNKKLYALKVYKSIKDNDLKEKDLTDIINRNYDSNNFIWPIKIVKYQGYLGYLMELLPNNYFCLSEYLANPGKFLQNCNSSSEPCTTILKLCINIIDSFRLLHSYQLSYKDISPNNIYFNKDTFDIKIIDNDNISLNYSRSSIKGTKTFLAPELENGTKKYPDRLTDYYSVSVIIFMIMMMNLHPFVTVQDKSGKESIHFVFEDQNNPTKYLCNDQLIFKDFWNDYPDVIRKMFLNDFTLGVLDQAKRNTDHQWSIILGKYFNALVNCENEDECYFYNPANAFTCEVCKKPYNKPIIKHKFLTYTMENNGNKLKNVSYYKVVNNNDKIYKLFVSDSFNNKFNPILSFECNSNKWRVKNLTNTVIYLDGKEVYPNSFSEYLYNSSNSMNKVSKKIIVLDEEIELLLP